MTMKTNRTIAQSLSILALLVAMFTGSGCTDEKKEVKPETGSLVDIDSNSYTTVKIGDQWWMAENLRVTRFSNGDAVSSISANDASGWSDATIPHRCTYQDLSSTPGQLYNFATVTDSRKIAPSGWHVATDEDWKKLEVFIGTSATDADKTGWRGEQGDLLKKTGLNAWNQYAGVWAVDKYLFSAEAGGCRLFDGRFSTPTGLTYNGFWWTSSVCQNGQSWYRYLDYKSSGVFRSHTSIGYGMSIRCVKD